MSETNEIVARVEEVERHPRPTYYGAFGLGQVFAWLTADERDSWKRLANGTLAFTIPGELESARLARIEQARDAVIQVLQGAMHDGNMNEDGDGFVIPLADYRQIQAELKALATQENAK